MPQPICANYLSLLPPPLGIGMLDQMGQSAFVATLGGTRSLVAVYMTLLAYEGWKNQDWAVVEKNYGVVHSLQPFDLQAWVREDRPVWPSHNQSPEILWRIIRTPAMRKIFRYQDLKLWKAVGEK